MRILLEDLKHETIQVSLDDLDDLWTLYNIVRKDDVVSSKTTREVKMEDASRPSSRRIPTTLAVRVEKVYFDKDLVRLRIHGVVVDAPDDLGILGSHHTLSLSPGSAVRIIKKSWARHEVDSLKKAATADLPVIIVALDNEECAIGVSRRLGVEIKVELNSRLPGKREAEKREQAMSKYLSDISDALTRVKSTVHGQIVIVGPAFAKEHLAGYLRNNFSNLSNDVVAVKSVSSGGPAGVFEALRVGLISKVLRSARTVRELELVEEVLSRLGASTGNVSYGVDEVSADAASGAIETVLVSDQTLRGVEGEDRTNLDDTLRMIEKKAGKVVIVSTGHEGGRKLESLGGIAALLRYAKHRET